MVFPIHSTVTISPGSSKKVMPAFLDLLMIKEKRNVRTIPDRIPSMKIQSFFIKLNSSSSPKSTGASLLPRLNDTKEAWNCMPHSQMKVVGITWKHKYGITAHADSVEPLCTSCVFNESFLRFHLQDKHNASIYNGLGAPNPMAKVGIISLFWKKWSNFSRFLCKS